MTENKTVEAEYSRWTESIVGSEVINGAKTEDTASESSDTENEKAVFLLEGKFYDDTSIQMAECDTDLPDGDVVYAYNWSLEHLHDKIYDAVKAHFYVPDTSGKMRSGTEKQAAMHGHWQKPQRTAVTLWQTFHMRQRLHWYIRRQITPCTMPAAVQRLYCF